VHIAPTALKRGYDRGVREEKKGKSEKGLYYNIILRHVEPLLGKEDKKDNYITVRKLQQSSGVFWAVCAEML
jgi:hypothetical protein